jgi:hypothetical protein
MGRVDLTAEALVVDPSHAHLFTATEREIAEAELWRYRNEDRVSGRTT